MDESGYAPNWKAGLDKQPYYVLSAVCLPSEKLASTYQEIRHSVSNLRLDCEGADKPLGQGFEIKARDVASGSGHFRGCDEKRNAIRDMMLEVPGKHGGTAFVVVINKQAHKRRYTDPKDPYQLSLEFIFERLQMYLSDINDYGICIYDQNKRIEDVLHATATNIAREGSELIYYSRSINSLVTMTFRIDRIIEFSFSRSENSIGLQLADFFATMTYFYVKRRSPSPCGWWDKSVSSLHRKDGKLQGVGYKEFP